MSLKKEVNEEYFRSKRNTAVAISSVSFVFLSVDFLSTWMGSGPIIMPFGVNFIVIIASWGLFGAALHLRESKEIAETVNMWSAGYVVLWVILGLGWAFLQFITLLNVFSVSSTNLTRLIILLTDLVIFIFFTASGQIPYVDLVWWVFVFLISLLVGLVFIEIGLNLSGMAVEISGGLIGLFAAIALGEVLKHVSTWRSIRSLHNSIEDELLDAHEELSYPRAEPIPIPIWTACVANGMLVNLKYRERRELTRIYKEIEFYNFRGTTDLRERAIEAIEDYFNYQDDESA